VHNVFPLRTRPLRAGIDGVKRYIYNFKQHSTPHFMPTNSHLRAEKAVAAKILKSQFAANILSHTSVELTSQNVGERAEEADAAVLSLPRICG